MANASDIIPHLVAKITAKSRFPSKNLTLPSEKHTTRKGR